MSTIVLTANLTNHSLRLGDLINYMGRKRGLSLAVSISLLLKSVVH